MDEVALKTLLETSTLPVAYNEWKGKPPSLPYLVYLLVGTSDFMADNKIYFQAHEYQVELYTSKKDPTTEALVEKVFSDNDIIPEKLGGDYLNSEQMYLTVYRIVV